jgi:hypothetical protein
MSPANIEIEKEFSERLTVYKNLGQEVIVTTVDKLRLCLLESRDCLTAKREWLTPLSLMLTLLTTLVAAEFRTFIFAPPVWMAIYFLGALLSFLWLFRAGHRAWQNRRRGSIEEIVERFKARGAE